MRIGFGKLSKRFALFLLPALVLGITAYYSYRNQLPAGAFVLANSQLTAPVEITRDRHGVPSIVAATDNDAYFAIGYIHAQDRLWQLEIQRRTVRGELSELLGRTAIEQDVWMRTLGLHHAAHSAWRALSPEAREALTRYTAGVNAASSARAVLPIEFLAAQARPGKWTEIDSLAWIKFFALSLSGNYQNEITHWLAQQQLPATQLKTFFPDYPEYVANAALPEHANAGVQRLATEQKNIFQKFQIGGRAVGSNAWAVSGKHTSDGGALLANDPHLPLQIPSLWYVIKVRGAKLDVEGMSLVGLPSIVFGHNRSIGWAGTNLPADTQDLFAERLSTPGHYEADGQPLPFLVRREKIHIRQDFPASFNPAYKPIAIEVRSTRHGPVITDRHRGLDQVLSLKWTSLDPDDTSFEAFYRLNLATNWEDFQLALGYLVAPTLNMLYGDQAGHIGYLAAGRVPVRKQGNGTVPVAGWNSEFAWTGAIAAQDMPRNFDPPEGILVSANDRPVPANYRHFISYDWAPSDRADRIGDLLRQKLRAHHVLTMDDMRTIQGDTVDLDVLALLPLLQKFQPTSARQTAALGILRAWNGDMSRDSRAAALFHAWVRHAREELFARQLSGSWNRMTKGSLSYLAKQVSARQLTAILTRADGVWCKGSVYLPGTSCNRVLSSSLDSAMRELEKITGDPTMERWTWGAIQETRYSHQPFSEVKPLRWLFEVRIPNGGSAHSVNVAVSELEGLDGYRQTFGPTFRHVIGLAPARNKYWYMNSTGQSGDVLSPHYDDAVLPFRNNHLRDIGQSGE